ncbi:MAG TPA: septal ring lytic transglycosylase RlpA family protein [Acidimicrobiales bacterium]|nr:septal ring lytic transglycosylase RlpA family protein [Acidimicrobiales bacterium]
MRRAALVGLVGLLVATVVLPLRPVDAAETTASLQAQRQVLVTRIARLTDEATRAHLRAAHADRKRAMSQAALLAARKRFAAHVVDAYLDGVQDTEDLQLRRRAWAGALAVTDEAALLDFRAAKERAENEEAAAAAANADARRTVAELETMRAALERTISDRITYERAKAKSAAKARASLVGGIGTSRHRRATGSQAELFRRYRFGPAAGVPAGLVATGSVLQGRASWYGPGFDGRATASGAIFDQEGWTVAHRTLPLGTILLISHGGRSVVVLVNDRGPFVGGRILDLSHGVAAYLGTVHAGVATVRAEILAPS